MYWWFNEPIIIIIISTTLIIGFLCYSYFNWRKRIENKSNSEQNLKQFYKDIIILVITYVLLVVPIFFFL
jgi:hypothetical protein